MTRYNISFSRVLRKDTKWVTKQVEIQENDEIEEEKKGFGMNKCIGSTEQSREMPHMTQDQRPQNKKGQTHIELQMGEKSEDPGDKRA
jgi:hypothetical protein